MTYLIYPHSSWEEKQILFPLHSFKKKKNSQIVHEVKPEAVRMSEGIVHVGEILFSLTNTQ